LGTSDFRNHDKEPPGRGLNPRLPKRALEMLTTQFLIMRYAWQFKEFLTKIMAAKRHRELCSNDRASLIVSKGQTN